MKIPTGIAKNIQWELWGMVAIPDESSPVGFIGGPRSPETELQEWQEGVDVIYRLLKSGILLLWPKGAIETDEDILDFAHALAEQNPYTITGASIIRDWGCPWMDPLLYTSPLAESLIKKHGINDSDAPLCVPFIEELEALFEAAGVPWTEEPLIPIRSTP